MSSSSPWAPDPADHRFHADIVRRQSRPDPGCARIGTEDPAETFRSPIPKSTKFTLGHFSETSLVPADMLAGERETIAANAFIT